MDRRVSILDSPERLDEYRILKFKELKKGEKTRWKELVSGFLAMKTQPSIARKIMPAAMRKRIRDGIAGVDRQTGEERPSGSVTSDVANVPGPQSSVPTTVKGEEEEVPPPLVRILASASQKGKMEEVPVVERDEEWHRQMNELQQQMDRDSREEGWENGAARVEAFFAWAAKSRSSASADAPTDNCSSGSLTWDEH